MKKRKASASMKIYICKHNKLAISMDREDFIVRRRYFHKHWCSRWRMGIRVRKMLWNRQNKGKVHGNGGK